MRRSSAPIAGATDTPRSGLANAAAGWWRIASRLLAVPVGLRQADLAQQVADAARGAQFAPDIGRQAQIALGVEPAGLGVGRQLAHDLGKGAEDRPDILG